MALDENIVTSINFLFSRRHWSWSWSVIPSAHAALRRQWIAHEYPDLRRAHAATRSKVCVAGGWVYEERFLAIVDSYIADALYTRQANCLGDSHALKLADRFAKRYHFPKAPGLLLFGKAVCEGCSVKRLDPVAMRAAGATYREISDATGVSKSALGRRLRAASPKTRCPWSQEDSETLVFLVRSGASVGEMKHAFRRSPSAIYKRAVDLGLGVGCPEGTELLQVAAQRTNFTAKTLARVLHWAGVAGEKAFSRGKGRKCYLSEDVDDAVASWHKTETVNAAAVRLGVATSTLLRWLREEGVLSTGRLTNAAHRVESTLLERVVRERRS